ncbi:hypothetical protein AURANDRAFT_68076 [Aureococcus anophagefferens]|uniref:Transmembrane protein n=1 Tax=Aureococcus anophagefferens TaxID=44056 RepID=F0YNE7_AURAN|nr:hypothetical protein AURANDRAFT_68076 [Aureococcus anophagefferens]EGB03360.1 hypothetical protein AURANDRAFT_68076 [Aureococcus anophagefferens]|eukprot:XP_009041933.1 hypothetical protein AURANDRAFT_68076 [Aureococcus anophagefferens]
MATPSSNRIGSGVKSVSLRALAINPGNQRTIKGTTGRVNLQTLPSCKLVTRVKISLDTKAVTTDYSRHTIEDCAPLSQILLNAVKITVSWDIVKHGLTRVDPWMDIVPNRVGFVRVSEIRIWKAWVEVSRGFIRLAFFISAFLLFLIAGTGVSVFDFSSPDIFVSPVSITRFSVETTIARTVISVEYSLYMKIEEVFMHVAAELQNIEINVYYNHHGAKRSIGFTKIPTTTIETGEISYVGGVLIAPITLDPAWASWFLEDLDAGILQLQIGPEDLVMDLYTRDSIFQWVSGINQQQIAYSYGCRVALYTRPREAVLSSPTAAPSSTHSISRTNESASAVSVGSTSQPVESYLSKTIAGVAHAATGGRIGYDPIQEELTNILGHGYDQECSPLPDQSIDMSRISVVANGCLFVACLAGLASCIQLVILRRLYRRTFDCIDVKNCDRIDAEKILGCVELSVLDESSVFHDLGASHVELH